MKSYIMKYYITFALGNKELKVKGEMSVEEGTPFYYDHLDEMIYMKVQSNDTARYYITSLYDDNENNLIDLPLEVWDKEFTSNLNITNVICSS